MIYPTTLASANLFSDSFHRNQISYRSPVLRRWPVLGSPVRRWKRLIYFWQIISHSPNHPADDVLGPLVGGKGPSLRANPDIQRLRNLEGLSSRCSYLVGWVCQGMLCDQQALVRLKPIARLVFCRTKRFIHSSYRQISPVRDIHID